jgi:hypothetical protein
MTVNGAPIQNGNVVNVSNTNGHSEPQPIEATAAYAHNALAYELSKIPFLSARRLKVIVAGAGASALSFAHEVQTGNLQNIDLQILEKNSGLGGTWFENQYPGCACDIPSHAYLVSSQIVVFCFALTDILNSSHGHRIHIGRATM